MLAVDVGMGVGIRSLVCEECVSKERREREIWTLKGRKRVVVLPLGG